MTSSQKPNINQKSFISKKQNKKSRSIDISTSENENIKYSNYIIIKRDESESSDSSDFSYSDKVNKPLGKGGEKQVKSIRPSFKPLSSRRLIRDIKEEDTYNKKEESDSEEEDKEELKTRFNLPFRQPQRQQNPAKDKVSNFQKVPSKNEVPARIERREVPIYAMTDIHMNSESLKGLTRLTDGILLINGDVLTGVKFDKKHRKLGSKNTHSIVPTKKGTWTDPQTAIDILSQRKSQYPLIVGLGNHELYEYTYRTSSIKNLEDWVSSLVNIGAVPLCTFPDFSSIGAYASFRFSSSYFFSYITSKYSINVYTPHINNRSRFESIAAYHLAVNIVKVIGSNTPKEIHLLLHAGFEEASNVVKLIFYYLLNPKNDDETPQFDVINTHYMVYIGHKHSCRIPQQYREGGKDWEGLIKLPLNGEEKNIHFVFPNCADDCVKVDKYRDTSIKARFISGR